MLPSSSYSQQQHPPPAASSSASAAAASADPLQLQHVIGYNGRYSNTLHYHPVNKDTLIFSIGGYVVIQDLNDRHKQEFLKGHDMELSALSVSNTGAYIASGQVGTEFQKLPQAPVILWDFNSRQPRFVLKGLKLKVKQLAFSPDDAFLAAIGQNNSLIIWDTKTGAPVYTKYSQFAFLQVCWGPMYGGGGTKHPGYVIVTMTSQVVNINQLDFDIASMQYFFKNGSCQLPSTGLVRNYTHSILGDDQILAGTQGGQICIFSISSRVYKGSLPLSSNGLFTLVKHDNFLFIGGGDGRVKKLDLIAGKWSLTHEAQLEGKVTALSISTDKKQLIAGTNTDRIYRLLTTDLSYLVHTQAHDGSVNDVSFSKTRSDQFCCIDSAGACKIWDSSEYKCVFNVKHPKLVGGQSCCILNDNTVLTGWDDGFVRCYDMPSGALIWEIANAHKGPVTAVYGDKNYILTGGSQGAVRVWARTTRQLLIQFNEHTKDVIGLFPDIKQVHIIHSASSDRSIATYDLKMERKLVGHQTNNGVLCGLSQRVDHEEQLGKFCTKVICFVVTCGHGAPIYFWDIDQQYPVSKVDVGPVKMTAISVSPSGKWMAVGSETSQIIVYDIREFDKIFRVSVKTGHSAPVTKIQWTPDQKQIISASSDESICVWNYYV